MLTRKVTDDDNFLSLSASAQALYLHLSMSADDDGFCNQLTIAMFRAHASITDLQALLEKRFIYQFENGVIVIKHWRMANALRKDRYTQTNFKEELAQLKIKENGSYTLSDDDDAVPILDKWLPSGCQVVANGLPQGRVEKSRVDNIRLEEDRVGEDIKENPIEVDTSKPHPQEVVDLFNRICVSYSTVRTLSDTRKKSIKARLNQYSIQEIEEVFHKAEESTFLKGGNEKNWIATFDWMMKDSSMAKILDGNYDNKANKRSGGSSAADWLNA